MRVTSRVFVDALLRRAAAGGAFAAVVRSGADQGGAIFVQVRAVTHDLYAPAMAGLAAGEQQIDDRRFTKVVSGSEGEVEERMRSETRFDPDLWWVEIEDGEGLSFLDPASLREE